jgi:hypothetical protein
MTRPVFGVDLDPAVIEANATRTKSGSLKRNPLLAVYGPGPEGAKCDGRWRHASGETKDGCLACADEAGICCMRLMPSRAVARVAVGTLFADISPETLYDLRARTVDGEPSWVLAFPAVGVWAQ